MKKVKYPSQYLWEKLCIRPKIDLENMENWMNYIFELVQNNGDEALKKFTLSYDKISLKDFVVDNEMLKVKADTVEEKLKTAILQAINNVRTFHNSGSNICLVETTSGVKCWKEFRAIEKVGLYVPGGTAPLFSSLIMQLVPAKIAGCEEIVICTPPDKNGEINNAIAFVAVALGVEKVYLVGGAQAIAAMAIGTETIPKVNKVFGPGNQYVAAAKVKAQSYGVAMDMFAGPSEVLVIADKSADPMSVCFDLLAQAEHSKDAQVLLLSTSESLLQNVAINVEREVEKSPRKEILKEALSPSYLMLFENLETCFLFSNQYAPEHLIINVENAEKYTSLIKNAGSVFLGPWSTEAFGDYNSGTNHALPTGGWCKSSSGLSVNDFRKEISFQTVSKQGFKNLANGAEVMAISENLPAHAMSVTYRKNLLNEKNGKVDTIRF